MCSGIALILGLFLLLRGQVVINNRIIPPNRTRIIGLVLMAPFAVGLIAGLFMLSPGGEIDLDMLQNAALIELGALIVAIAIVYYLISTTPRSEMAPLPAHRMGAPLNGVTPPVPNILTVPEAAAYLRVSEGEVIRLIDDGKLAAARIGDSYRIARIAIEDFMKAGRD
jgi:excisionase family DNA binding protein